MTASQRPDRQRVSEDHAFATLLREGQGYERCYDAFAASLYRYCWTLLGPRSEQEEDAVAAAVHETFLAAVELLPQLQDLDLFRSWLFALARAACERRGLTPDSPYALLSVHEEEQPFVEVLGTLPPSQRELLELSLRHSLSHTQTAVVLGLDPETVSDLCRSAAQRVADLVTEKNQAEDGSGARWIIADVPLALNSVALPGPPRHLREQVVADCSASEAAPRRQAAAALVRPLGANGFPLQRVRGTDPGTAGPDGPEAAADPEEHTAPASSLDADAEPLSAPAAAQASEEPQRLSGWLLPATAGLVTALVAFTLWGLGAFLNSSDDTLAGALPPVDGVTASPMSEHAPQSTEPDSGGAPPVEVSEPAFEPPPAVEPEPAAEPEPAQPGGADGGTGGGTDSGTGGGASGGAGSSTGGGAESGGSAPSTGGAEPAPPPAPPPAPAAPQEPVSESREEPVSQPEPAPAPAPEESPRRPGSGVVSLLEGVLGLLGLSGRR